MSNLDLLVALPLELIHIGAGTGIGDGQNGRLWSQDSGRAGGVEKFHEFGSLKGCRDGKVTRTFA